MLRSMCVYSRHGGHVPLRLPRAFNFQSCIFRKKFTDSCYRAAGRSQEFHLEGYEF